MDATTTATMASETRTQNPTEIPYRPGAVLCCGSASSRSTSSRTSCFSRVCSAPGGGTREAGVHAAHAAVAAEEDRRRVRAEVDELRQRVVDRLRRRRRLHRAGEQHRILDAVSLDERLHARARHFRIRIVLEHQPDDLEAARAVIAVDLAQERRLVVAVRAPASADRQDHDLAAESRVGIRRRSDPSDRERRTGTARSDPSRSCSATDRAARESPSRAPLPCEPPGSAPCR